MSTKVFNIIIKMVKEGGGDKDTVSGLISIKNAMTQGMAVAGAMVGAYYTVDKVLQATVGTFATYAKGVDVFSSALNTTAQESSRLIQVADDFGISSDEMQAAMFRAVKGGMTPTIAGLADMADRYNALASPQAKADFLTKNFGKSSQELTRLLGEGGQAIRDRSASVADSLVLDADAIQKAREYEAVQDDLADATMAFKVAAGQKIMPWWIEVIQGITNVAQGQRDITLGQEEFNRRFGEQAQAIEYVNGKEEDYILSTKELTAATADYADELKNITSFAKQYETGVQNIATAQESLSQAEEDLAALRKAGYSEWGTKVTEAKQKVNDLTGELIDARQASQDATNEMIAGFLQTQLTMDGTFTEEDMTKVLDYRLKMGLLTQEAYDAALNALHIAENLAKIPAETSSHVTITTDYYYNKPTGGGGQTGHGGTSGEQMASGGFFTENMARVGERGEEWLVRTPSGGVVVLPNDIVRRLQAWGISPGVGFAAGEGGGASGWIPPAWRPGIITRTPSLTMPGSGLPAYAAGNITGNNPYNQAGLSPTGSSGAAAVSQVAAAAAVQAVSPVVTDAMHGFQAAQQVSTQANTQQVAQQTRAVQQAGEAQAVLLRAILSAIEGQPEALAVEIQKRR